MASITTRVGKGSPLTTQELDANFTNLNADKLEKSGESAAFADLTLSTVSATLHRSPNAITALFVYDTSKDSDPTWVDRCTHTSWYQETIYGKWLGARASESAARAVTGATTDDYFQLTTDGKFYKLNATSGTTEVFRGNKRAFPKLAAIVAESTNVTIYDLTEVGRPMFCRFIATATATITSKYLLSGANALAATNGRIYVGGTGTNLTGLTAIDFAKDTASLHLTSGYTWNGNLSTRNTVGGYTTVNAAVGGIANATANAVATTVLPDAPVDPVTGLRVPTIAVATNGGASVIRHTGAVETKSYVSAVCKSVAFDGAYLLVGGVGPDAFFGAWVWDLRDGAVQDYGRYSGSVVVSLNNNFGTLQVRRFGDEYAAIQGAGLNLLRQNKSASTRALLTRIAPTYNTGWMTGDIRRCFLSYTEAGSVTGPGLVTNGTFDTDVSGWSADTTFPPASFTWNAGAMVVTGSGATYNGVKTPISTVVGRTYRISASITGSGYISVASGSGGWAPTYNVTVFTATATTTYITAATHGSNVATYDNISVKEAIADRSYKATAANILGTLTATAGNTGNDLVAYSGFSAANYIQEPYSTDLDFGTGEWSVGAWVNVPSVMDYFNIVTLPENLSSWGLVNCTVQQDVISAPNGAANADRIVESSGPGVNVTAFVPGPDTYYTANHTLSIYAKEDPGSNKRYLVLGFRYSSETRWSYAVFDVATMTVTTTRQEGIQNVVASSGVANEGNGWARCYVSFSSPLGDQRVFISLSDTPTPTNAWSTPYTGDGVSGMYLWGAQFVPGTAPVKYLPGKTTAVSKLVMAQRGHSSAPTISINLTNTGRLSATAYDGTTTRTVTTSAAYNTGTWLKADATYTTDGALKLWVNGVEVASATGAPLLTLNNSNAVLTIGNSYALDAPFPGSIALLKFSATVPTAEQALFMYEQEKHLFTAGAKCVLPASTSVLDLAYDDATDTWSTLQATHEASWSGLVRTSTQTPSAGSFSVVAEGSGVQLLSRTTTNPGVDVQMPAKNLRPKDMPKDTNQDIVVLDYLGGFTATTTNGSTSLTSVAGSLVPASTNLIGCAISGTGIPASTVITAVSGTTIFISKAATADGSNIQISTTDFNLPVGYTARAVLTAGTLRREGSTADFTRRYDGFRETIRYAVAPGFNAWVQIQAVKEVAL